MYVKGLNFLRDHQKEDGTFSTPGRSDSYGSQPGVVGLAIVAKVAEAHGGRVEVESVPGEGTRIILRLHA